MALSADAKPYTTAAGIKALEDHFADREGVVVGTGAVPNTYRITWPLPEWHPLVSVVIPTKDQPRLLQLCLNSLLGNTDYDYYRVILVDNGTTDPEALAYLDEMSQDYRVQVLSAPGPFNFSALCNAGAKEAKGELLLLLNNDIEVRTPH